MLFSRITVFLNCTINCKQQRIAITVAASQLYKTKQQKSSSNSVIFFPRIYRFRNCSLILPAFQSLEVNFYVTTLHVSLMIAFYTWASVCKRVWSTSRKYSAKIRRQMDEPLLKITASLMKQKINYICLETLKNPRRCLVLRLFSGVMNVEYGSRSYFPVSGEI